MPMFKRGCVVLLMIVAAACGGKSPTAPSTTPSTTGGSSTTSGSLFNGIAATLTDDSAFGAIAASPNGEKLGAAMQTGSAGQIVKVTGATFILPDGNSAVVYAGNDGLPARAVFGDVAVLFSNYTSNTVDIAVVAPNGTVTNARGVPVDADRLADLKSLQAQLSASGGVSTAILKANALSPANALALVLKAASLTVSIAACPIALGLTPLSAGASFIIASGACLGTIVAVLKTIDPTFDTPLLTASGTLMSAATCAGGSPTGCASTILNLLRAATNKADTILSSSPSRLTADFSITSPANGSVIRLNDRFRYSETIVNSDGNPSRWVSAVGFIRDDGATRLFTCGGGGTTSRTSISADFSFDPAFIAFGRGHTVNVVFAIATAGGSDTSGTGGDCSPLADFNARTILLDKADVLRLDFATNWVVQ